LRFVDRDLPGNLLDSDRKNFMTPFTPETALAGGALIGLAAAVLLLGNGRIAGISGIIGGLFVPKATGLVWRLLFIAGILLGALLYQALGGATYRISIDASPAVLLAAGLLVGFGTRMGSGCTSGHGVCGISRLSVRSIVATLVFMATAAATVFVVRHVLGGAT